VFGEPRMVLHRRAPALLEVASVELELEQAEQEVLLVGDDGLAEDPLLSHPADGLADGDV